MLATVYQVGATLLAAPHAAPIPDPTSQPIPGLTTFSNDFLGWIKWVLIIAGVGSLMVCGIMMAVGRRGRSEFAAQGAVGVPWTLAGLALGGVAATIVGAVIS